MLSAAWHVQYAFCGSFVTIVVSVFLWFIRYYSCFGTMPFNFGMLPLSASGKLHSVVYKCVATLQTNSGCRNFAGISTKRKTFISEGLGASKVESVRFFLKSLFSICGPQLLRAACVKKSAGPCSYNKCNKNSPTNHYVHTAIYMASSLPPGSVLSPLCLSAMYSSTTSRRTCDVNFTMRMSGIGR